MGSVPSDIERARVDASKLDERLYRLTREQMEAFPLGIIELDPAGIIVSYNDAVARIGRREPSSAIGRGFFTDVAPCAAVREFQGRFLRFSELRVDSMERSTFVFRFAWGDVKVWLTMVSRADNPGHVYVVVDAAA